MPLRPTHVRTCTLFSFLVTPQRPLQCGSSRRITTRSRAPNLSSALLAWSNYTENFAKLTAKLHGFVRFDGQFFLTFGKLAIKNVNRCLFPAPLRSRNRYFRHVFSSDPRLTGTVSPSRKVYYRSSKVGVSKSTLSIFGFHARILRAARKCSSGALLPLVFRLVFAALLRTYCISC